MKTKLQNIHSNDGAFHDGNPATGTLGTVVTAKWLNDVQEITQDYFEEAKNILALAGITPNPAKSNQIADAIARYVKQKTDTKVNLTGNETISGEKTFINRLKAHNGLKISYTYITADQGHYAEMFADGNTTWLNFKNHVFRWHADGNFSVDGKKFFGEGNKPRFADIVQKPTSLDGYGIADGVRFKNLIDEDLNRVINVGLYGQQGNINATPARHYPIAEAGTLRVTPSAYGVMQSYTGYSSKKVYVRNQTQSGWDAWVRIDGIEAMKVAQSKQSPQTTLSGYGIRDGVKFKYLEHEDLNAVTQIGIYGQGANVNATSARHYPVSEAGTLVVSPSAYGVMQSYTTYSTKSQYVRNQLDSGWNAWVRVDGIEAMRIAQSKQSPQTTLSGYGITDAVKQLDMRGTHNRVKFDDASPAQLPQGSFVGLSEKAALESRIAHGWKFISKGWGDQSGAYSCVRLGITDNRFYFQTARDWNNWNAPLEIHHSGLGYLSATTSNYGGINIERPDRNDKMLMESNGNQFAFIRRNRGNGQNHYAILLPERSGTAMLSSDVAVLTGTIAHGGTIPLPAGFTEAQCKWFVSINNSNRDNAMWDIKEDGGHNHFRLECWTSGRTVHARQLRHDSGRQNYHNMTANYLIIGVK